MEKFFFLEFTFILGLIYCRCCGSCPDHQWSTRVRVGVPLCSSVLWTAPCHTAFISPFFYLQKNLQIVSPNMLRLLVSLLSLQYRLSRSEIVLIASRLRHSRWTIRVWDIDVNKRSLSTPCRGNFSTKLAMRSICTLWSRFG